MVKVYVSNSLTVLTCKWEKDECRKHRSEIMAVDFINTLQYVQNNNSMTLTLLASPKSQEKTSLELFPQL